MVYMTENMQVLCEAFWPDMIASGNYQSGLHDITEIGKAIMPVRYIQESNSIIKGGEKR